MIEGVLDQMVHQQLVSMLMDHMFAVQSSVKLNERWVEVEIHETMLVDFPFLVQLYRWLCHHGKLVVVYPLFVSIFEMEFDYNYKE